MLCRSTWLKCWKRVGYVPSVLPYGAPILFVHNKMVELRMCVDFHSLNHQTQLDMFPIQRIHDLLDKLGKARVFSAIDLLSAYH